MEEQASKKRKENPGEMSGKTSGATDTTGIDQHHHQEEDPLVLLARVREERRVKLQEENGGADVGGAADLALTIRMVRALMCTNEEIWGRITKDGIRKDFEGKIFFARLIYRRVDVKKTRRWDHDETSNNSVFEVSATYERTTASQMGIPMHLPSELSSIIAEPFTDETRFPDYRQIFETLLLLQNDVLLPVLVAFRKHLEDVHVALGKVDTWLAEIELCSTFINDCFDMEIPEPKIINCTCATDVCSAVQIHRDDDICLRCGVEHQKHGQACQRFGHLCHDGMYATYHTKHTLELKTVSNTGEHKETFDICNEVGRTKLKKFLDFLS